MKIKNFLLCATFIFASLLTAEPGCMDNSWHLQRPFDDKDYHYVYCNCECTKRHKILADRGKCLQCGHYRIPKNFIIIDYEDNDSVAAAPKKCKKTATKVVFGDKTHQ